MANNPPRSWFAGHMEDRQKMSRIFAALSAGILLLALTACESTPKRGDYAALVNAAGRSGMAGNGPSAGGANSYPGYPELPIEGGSRGSWAPSTGNFPPITALSEGSRGNGIANDSGGIGIGIH
jgi:hypothetical protein